MRYKHYLVLNAESGELASSRAWWHVLNSPDNVSGLDANDAISEHGEIFGDEFHEGDTIKDIEKEILHEMEVDNGSGSYKSSVENLVKRWQNGESLKGMEYWTISEHFRYMSSVAHAPKVKTFKKGLEFRPGEWQYLGVTNLYDKDEPGDLWVVIIWNK